MHTDIARMSLEDVMGGSNGLPTSELVVPKAFEISAYSGSAKAVDITKEFTEASAALEQGQLIKDDFFTLFEAVGALEIMDPKMDSGHMMPSKDTAVDEFDPTLPLLPSEVIAIMDQMLCYESAWHEGYPLSQTLFTSLHLNALLDPSHRPLSQIAFASRQSSVAKNPDLLITDVLRAYCLGVLKCCDSVIIEILSEHFYEEEDFVTQNFAQYLLSDVTNDSIVAVLQQAIETLTSLDLSPDFREALTSRLKLRMSMVQAFQPINPIQNQDKAERWRVVADALATVNKTHVLAKPVPDAFSERVQRYLASNAPPRPMIEIRWEDAYTKLTRLCEDNIEAHSAALLPHPGPFNIIRLTHYFSSRRPQPLTYSRAIFQGVLFKQGAFAARIPHLDLLMWDVKELVLAGDPLLDLRNWDVEMPSDPRHRIARKVDEFMSKALEEYLNIPRMLSQNRCRVRRTLSQSIAILDSLQAEAEMVDAAIHDIIASIPASSPLAQSLSLSFHTPLMPQEPMNFFPLAAWSYFHKLEVMQWSVQLGFELDVYLDDELPGMYAFVAFLARTREEHLAHVELFANLRVQKLRNMRRKDEVAEAEQSRRFISSLASRAKVDASLSSALSSLHALLRHLSLIPVLPRPYGNQALRHELRMKPFLPIGTPSLPSHQDLLASISFAPTTPLSTIFAGIDAALKDAKTHLAALKATTAADGKFEGCEKMWALEIKGLLGSVVGTGLAVAKVRQVLEGLRVKTLGDVVGRLGEVREGVRVEMLGVEGRFHVWWVVPRVVDTGK